METLKHTSSVYTLHIVRPKEIFVDLFRFNNQDLEADIIEDFKEERRFYVKVVRHTTGELEELTLSVVLNNDLYEMHVDNPTTIKVVLKYLDLQLPI